MATTPTESDAGKITIELTRAEALAVANALFMCLRPNNVRAPFDTVVEREAMERGYERIAGPVSELRGCRCARCGRTWAAGMRPWDAFGDPETGELELVCEDSMTAEEQALFAEHHERLANYAKQRSSAPAWQRGPEPTSEA